MLGQGRQPDIAAVAHEPARQLLGAPPLGAVRHCLVRGRAAVVRQDADLRQQQLRWWTQGQPETSSLTSYTAPTVDTSALMGATPEATLLNIINVFIYFFRSYGALIVLLGIFSLKAVTEGRKRGGTGTSIIMSVFGFAVMNVDTIAAAVMQYFA